MILERILLLKSFSLLLGQTLYNHPHPTAGFNKRVCEVVCLPARSRWTLQRTLIAKLARAYLQRRDPSTSSVSCVLSCKCTIVRVHSTTTWKFRQTCLQHGKRRLSRGADLSVSAECSSSVLLIESSPTVPHRSRELAAGFPDLIT